MRICGLVICVERVEVGVSEVWGEVRSEKDVLLGVNSISEG